MLSALRDGVHHGPPKQPDVITRCLCLHLVRLEADEQFILAVVATTSPEVLCQLCQCRSQSMHSRYVRVVVDLPWADWAVRLELHVRRFFCPNKECMRTLEQLHRIFYATRGSRAPWIASAMRAFVGGDSMQKQD
jgi:transposase